MTTYPPLGTLKPAGRDLWVVDGPAVGHRGIPHSTRATVARLSDGGLWVHSPTGLGEGLAAELRALGPVAYLVAPNRDHRAFLDDWRAAFPQATVAVWPEHGSDIAMPWRAEIGHLVVGAGTRPGEAVFFHRASRTLIVADLIQNFETARLPVWMRPLVWLAGTDDDSGGRMAYLRRWRYRRADLAQAVERMIDWAPEALILSHGRWYREGAVAELERAFRPVLQDRRWQRALDRKGPAGGD